MHEALRILCVGVPVPAGESGAFAVETVAAWPQALALLGGGATFDIVLLDGDRLAPAAHDVDLVVARSALVIVTVEPDAEHAIAWLRRGAADVMTRDEVAGSGGARRLRFAGERSKAARSRGKAYATDLATGLPHRQQLVEHLSQLLALREREPAPMAVLALRMEGLAPSAPSATEGGDAEDAQAEDTQTEALRRKIGVRLRAGVRASDVVASLEDSGFAVLLGSVLAPEDAERVAEKLVASLLLPFALAGGERSVAVGYGIGHYPQDGRDAERLLRRALALAAVAPATRATGPSTAHDAAGTARVAANDER